MPPPASTPAPASVLPPVLVPDRSAWLTMRWCTGCGVGWRDTSDRWSECWFCYLPHDAEAVTVVDDHTGCL